MSKIETIITILMALGVWAVLFGASLALVLWVLTFIEDRVRYRLTQRRIVKSFQENASKPRKTTIYEEMMADPQNAEAILVDRVSFPDDVLNAPKSEGAKDQSIIDNATEFRRDFA